MSKIRVSVSTVASPAAVWRLWTNVSASSAWDTDVAWSRLHGPFAVGTRGELKLKGLPTLSFVLDEVTKEQSYANVVSMPGLRVRFTHDLEPQSATTMRITHGAEIGGRLGWLVRPLVRRPLTRALATALDNFVRLAEAAEPESAPRPAARRPPAEARAAGGGHA
jgi:hypothetical protein